MLCISGRGGQVAWDEMGRVEGREKDTELCPGVGRRCLRQAVGPLKSDSAFPEDFVSLVRLESAPRLSLALRKRKGWKASPPNCKPPLMSWEHTCNHCFAHALNLFTAWAHGCLWSAASPLATCARQQQPLIIFPRSLLLLFPSLPVSQEMS